MKFQISDIRLQKNKLCLLLELIFQKERKTSFNNFYFFHNLQNILTKRILGSPVKLYHVDLLLGRVVSLPGIVFLDYMVIS